MGSEVVDLLDLLRYLEGFSFSVNLLFNRVWFLDKSNIGLVLLQCHLSFLLLAFLYKLV